MLCVFFSCFPDFLLVFSFQQFQYNVSGWGSLCVFLLGVINFWNCGLMFFIRLEIWGYLCSSTFSAPFLGGVGFPLCICLYAWCCLPGLWDFIYLQSFFFCSPVRVIEITQSSSCIMILFFCHFKSAVLSSWWMFHFSHCTFSTPRIPLSTFFFESLLSYFPLWSCFLWFSWTLWTYLLQLLWSCCLLSSASGHRGQFLLPDFLPEYGSHFSVFFPIIFYWKLDI